MRRIYPITIPALIYRTIHFARPLFCLLTLPYLRPTNFQFPLTLWKALGIFHDLLLFFLVNLPISNHSLVGRLAIWCPYLLVCSARFFGLRWSAGKLKFPLARGYLDLDHKFPYPRRIAHICSY